MKKFIQSRIGSAVMLVLCSAVCTVFLAGILSLIAGNFWGMCKAVFLCFFAFPVVGAALLILTNIQEDWAMQFGGGLYYGTLVVSSITKELGWGMRESDRLLLGFVLSSLICYIVHRNLTQKRDER